MPRSRIHRAGLIVTAVFQFLLPAFASVADARAEAASERGAFAHVESHGTSTCVPVHPADCAVCRVLSDGAAPSQTQAVFPAPECLVSPALPPYRGLALGTGARHGPSQRAPPAV